MVKLGGGDGGENARAKTSFGEKGKRRAASEETREKRGKKKERGLVMNSNLFGLFSLFCFVGPK